MNYWQTNLEKLVPAVYHLRDAQQKHQFTALLKVIAEQMDVLHENVQQLYSDWFIETCQPWCVPYIGDLVGFREQFHGELPPITDPKRRQIRNKFLFPRAEVANAVRSRRKKGTAKVMEELVASVAGWKGTIKDVSVEIARTAQTLDSGVPCLGGSQSENGQMGVLPELRTVNRKPVPSHKLIELDVYRHDQDHPLNMLRGLGGGKSIREDRSNYSTSTHLVRVWEARLSWDEIYDSRNKQLKHQHTIIEICDDTAPDLPDSIKIGKHQTLELKARRDSFPEFTNKLEVALAEHGKLILDGISFAGNLTVSPSALSDETARKKECEAQQAAENSLRPTLEIRHATLEQSVQLNTPDVVVEVSNSVVNGFEAADLKNSPAFVSVTDSVLVGESRGRQDIRLSIERSTILESLSVREIWGQDCIFVKHIDVINQQVGGLRFCYEPSKPEDARTPCRYQCLPDILEANEWQVVDKSSLFYSSDLKEPMGQFCVIRLGSDSKLVEAIRNGSEVESEMGVYHDLYLPQRERNLNQWLDEFTPVGMQTKINFNFDEVTKQ